MNLKAWIFVAKYRIQLHDIYSRIFYATFFLRARKYESETRGTNSDWCYQRNLNEIILKCLFLLLFAAASCSSAISSSRKKKKENCVRVLLIISILSVWEWRNKKEKYFFEDDVRKYFLSLKIFHVLTSRELLL